MERYIVYCLKGKKGHERMDKRRQEWNENDRLHIFHADEIIIQEGRIYNELFEILKGSVAVYIRYGQKDEHLIGIYSKTRCFGEMNVLSGKPSSYTVVACEEVLSMRITKDFLENLIRSNPQRAADTMRNIMYTSAALQDNIYLLLEDIHEKQKMNQEQAKDGMQSGSSVFHISK